MIAFALAAALLATPADAAQDQPARREPTAQESASFTAFYRAHAPGQTLPAHAFDITRAPGQRAWDIRAAVDAPASRGLAPLCRMTRSVFAYSPQAPAKQRWKPAGERHYAWVDRAGCGKPTRQVELRQRIPDANLVPLIDQHGVLLLRARLLFSGNTSCAPYRALRYRIVAIDVSAPPHGREQLYGLVFLGDGARATVWVKQRADGIHAWNVACTALAPAP